MFKIIDTSTMQQVDILCGTLELAQKVALFLSLNEKSIHIVQ